MGAFKYKKISDAVLINPSANSDKNMLKIRNVLRGNAMNAQIFNLIKIATLTFVLTSSWACGGGGASISVFPSEDSFQQNTNADVKIDILFVVDDSGSMAQEQQDVYDNFREFIDLFYNKGFDFRVAVAKTSAYGSTIACKRIDGGQNFTCANSTTGTNPYYKKDGGGNFIAGDFLSRESGLTPKEFRCGFGNNCGFNSNLQQSLSIAGTTDPEAPDNGTQTLQTTVGNGTPGPSTDHILSSANLTRNQMIDKFKKNILVGLAGNGDERGIESAETVIRNMKQFYPDPNQRFPRPGSHLAVIHVGDEGDGAIPNAAEDTFHGSNRGGATTSTTGSLRSTHINNVSNWPGYTAIPMMDTSSNKSLTAHLTVVDNYLDGLKRHELTSTVSVHSIEDMPNAAGMGYITSAPFNIPTSASSDNCGNSNNTQATNAIGYYQAYMAAKSGGLVLSKCNNFGQSLSQLGDTISSLASFFTLQNNRLDDFAQENLKVYVEGLNNNNAIPNSAVNGYQYDYDTNRIRFFGSMIPAQGAKIGLVYTCSTLECPAFP